MVFFRLPRRLLQLVLLLCPDAPQINHLPQSLLKKVTENAFDVAPAGQSPNPLFFASAALNTSPALVFQILHFPLRANLLTRFLAVAFLALTVWFDRLHLSISAPAAAVLTLHFSGTQTKSMNTTKKKVGSNLFPVSRAAGVMIIRSFLLTCPA